MGKDKSSQKYYKKLSFNTTLVFVDNIIVFGGQVFQQTTRISNGY